MSRTPAAETALEAGGIYGQVITSRPTAGLSDSIEAQRSPAIKVRPLLAALSRFQMDSLRYVLGEAKKNEYRTGERGQAPFVPSSRRKRTGGS